MDDALKPVLWMASSKKDLLDFPPETIRDVGPFILRNVETNRLMLSRSEDLVVLACLRSL